MKKSLAVLTASSLLLVVSPLGPVNRAHAVSSPYYYLDRLTEATWDQIGLQTGIPESYVGWNSGVGEQSAALRYDLSSIASGVRKATLRIHPSSAFDGYSHDSVLPVAILIGSTNDGSFGDYNYSAPINPNDQEISRRTIIPIAMPEWIEFDVTEFVNEQLQEDPSKVVTFALVGEGGEATATEFSYATQYFPSGELDYRPQLVVEFGAHAPTVASATTAEDVLTGTRVTITPNAADVDSVNFIRISNIVRGKLFLRDGTEVTEGMMITTADGADGLAFMPDADANSEAGDTFSFDAQAAWDDQGTGLSSAATATITVTSVNDAPIANDDSLQPIDQNSGELTIPYAALLSNDSRGPANEAGQTLDIVDVDADPSVGTVRLSGSNVIFTPAPDYHGTASFTYKVRDNGTTNGEADSRTSEAAVVSFQVSPAASAPIVTNASTDEDTMTAADELVITATNALGVATTNYYKISGITGGTLYMSNGTTLIANNSFITVSEGLAGLRFLPNVNAYGTTGFGFQVQAAPGNDDTKLSAPVGASITVAAVNDDSVAVNDTLSEIGEDSGVRTIPFAALLANDSAGPNEADQELTVVSVSEAVGGTVVIDGMNVVFTPETNYSGPAGFKYKIGDNGEPARESNAANASFAIYPVADIPTFTNAVTREDRQTSSGLQFFANPLDGIMVQYFKIGNIFGGTLYKNDGTTEIRTGDFISVYEGEGGLKFSPNANANMAAGDTFSVEAQAAIEQSDKGLSEKVTATIYVSDENDWPIANADDLGVIADNAGVQVIDVSRLIGNDKPGPDNESDQTLRVIAVGNPVGGTVSLNDGATQVTFTPTAGFLGRASFEYTIEDNGTSVEWSLEDQPLGSKPDPQQWTGTASLTILERPDAPNITDATTAEDTMTSNGLVITPNGSGTTTHYKIDYIQRGKLYLQDGTTRINNGDYITVSEGAAGLKFMPDANAHTLGFGFEAQAAPGTDGTLLSDPVMASITVNEVNDDPIALDDTLEDVAYGTSVVTIPFSALTGNDSAGPADERVSQTLSVVNVEANAGGEVGIVDGHVEFHPDPEFLGTASFTYTVSDGGRTDNAVASFNIGDKVKPTITLNGGATVYILQGESFTEPGYSAEDNVDGDLTNEVTVTGSVDTSTIGTYSISYNLSDVSNNVADTVRRTVRVVHTGLSALSAATDLGLTPAFSTDVQDYELNVPYANGTLEITASPVDPTATVSINGLPANDAHKGSVDLRVGDNVVTIVVTAQGGATRTYTLDVTRQAAPPAPAPTPAPTPTPMPTQTTRQAKVVTGDAKDANIVQVEITRQKNESGKDIDTVSLQGSKVEEVVAKAAADDAKTARIVIDDLPDQPADEVVVNLSSDSLGKLKGAELGLVIEASGARITLAADTLSQLSTDGKDLFFRVVPIRTSEEVAQVQERVMDTAELQTYAQGANIRAIGKPMTIETNYVDRKTKVMFPLANITLPADPQERQKFLSGLGMFIEHTDGEKEVAFGDIVYDESGAPIGLEIEVRKFSTFTFLTTEADFKTYLHYISGYPDGTFRPFAQVTRAEIASLIARQLEAGATSPSDRYKDVAYSHWAAKAVLQLTAAGIMSGDTSGTFRPEASVTRAEMAVILANLMKLDVKGSSNAPQDAANHWAAGAITAVQAAGLMVGYEDGAFRPEQKLTRAEAVRVLNGAFERPALTDRKSAWPDVPSSNWASGDIESASHDFRVYKDGSITELE